MSRDLVGVAYQICRFVVIAVAMLLLGLAFLAGRACA